MLKPANLNIKYEYRPLTFNIKDLCVYTPIEQTLHVTKTLNNLNKTEKMIKQQIIQSLHTLRSKPELFPIKRQLL
jgi:hypothetical protein